jgi:hypothetical protein
MPQISIGLPTDLTTQHRRVVLKYFEKTERLSPQDKNGKWHCGHLIYWVREQLKSNGGK